jgi:hypothetical protein
MRRPRGRAALVALAAIGLAVGWAGEIRCRGCDHKAGPHDHYRAGMDCGLCGCGRWAWGWRLRRGEAVRGG